MIVVLFDRRSATFGDSVRNELTRQVSIGEKCKVLWGVIDRQAAIAVGRRALSYFSAASTMLSSSR
jgi:hypothetical protein